MGLERRQTMRETALQQPAFAPAAQPRPASPGRTLPVPARSKTGGLQPEAWTNFGRRSWPTFRRRLTHTAYTSLPSPFVYCCQRLCQKCRCTHIFTVDFTCVMENSRFPSRGSVPGLLTPEPDSGFVPMYTIGTMLSARCRQRRWSSQLGGVPGLQGSPGKARSPRRSCHRRYGRHAPGPTVPERSFERVRSTRRATLVPSD